MTESCYIGLDFGTASARGVLLGAATGRQLASHEEPYPHGTLSTHLPDGTVLREGFALQVPGDYTQVAKRILREIGAGRIVLGIGLGFTASSPMPTTADGTPLAELFPADPHAHVKLWRHNAAAQAARLTAGGGAWMANFGGKVSGEWFLAKAAEVAEEAPASWARTERFIEAGDWMVWQLTGREVRSSSFAAFKAQWTAEGGYPEGSVPGLAERVRAPVPVGSAAGVLSEEWASRTGITGRPVVATAVIDGHVVLPAVGAVRPGIFTGALGTSAAFVYVSDELRPLPSGIEGAAHDAALPNLACYEAGIASFGQTLAWFAQELCRGGGETMAELTEAASHLQPGECGLVALDWWGGNRVPFADGGLSGLIAGLTPTTTRQDIWRALLESLCFGTRAILDRFAQSGFPISRVVMTSGVAARSDLLLRIMSDVLGRPIEVPRIDNATAVGAAIHGALAAEPGLTLEAAAKRYAPTRVERFEPDPGNACRYEVLYEQFRILGGLDEIRQAMHRLTELRRPRWPANPLGASR